MIFTTAWAQHAAEAFELGALDYLLKPFGADRLALTLERVRSTVGEPAVAPALDRDREGRRAGPISRVFVRSGRAIIPVAIDSVSWFEADGDYVAVHVGRALYLVHVTRGWHGLIAEAFLKSPTSARSETPSRCSMTT